MMKAKPILQSLLFEESGKGAVAVQQFTIAAELTGSIIVGS